MAEKKFGEAKLVEYSAVKRVIVDSSPARGGKCQRDDAWESP
jgi:hypothetical protein